MPNRYENNVNNNSLTYSGNFANDKITTIAICAMNNSMMLISGFVLRFIT